MTTPDAYPEVRYPPLATRLPDRHADRHLANLPTGPSVGADPSSDSSSRIGLDWDTVVLLCSDGLTRLVPDERIRERLRTMTSSRQVCEALLEDALAAGGSDNITIVVRRAVPHDG